MSRFKSALEAGGALGIQRELCIGDQRFLCFTRFSDAEARWLFVVLDGMNTWRVGLSEVDVREYSQEKGESGYISDVSRTLESGEAELLHAPNHLTLSLHCPAEQVEFTLFEVAAAECRLEMKQALFNVWDSLSATTSKLTECQQELSTAQKQMAPEQPVLADVTLRSGVKVAPRPKKPAGHSLINPSSKRRKAATGVVFGDS